MLREYNNSSEMVVTPLHLKVIGTGYLPRVFSAIILILVGLGCSSSGQPRIPIKGMYPRARFSSDGNYLMVTYQDHYVKVDPDYLGSDSLIIIETGTWNKVLEFHTDLPTKINQPFICGSLPVVAIAESNENRLFFDLIFMGIPAGEEIRRISRDPYHSPSPGQPTIFFCDHENNMVYLQIYRKKISVLDSVNGEKIREYLLTDSESDVHEFLVQKKNNRLIAVDNVGGQIFTFNLSTGVQQGIVKMLPPPSSEISRRNSPTFQNFALIDDDHILYQRLHSDAASGSISTLLYIVDIAESIVANQTMVDQFYAEAILSIEENETVIIAGHKWDELNGFFAVVNYNTGEILRTFYDNVPGANSAYFMPTYGRLLIVDWSVPADKAAWIFSYPEFKLLHHGAIPVETVDMLWVENGRFLIMSSPYNDKFGVYDPINYRILDVFPLCTHVGFGMQVDPNERWAAIECDGEFKEDEYPLPEGSVPAGAGIAIIDLDNYR